MATSIAALKDSINEVRYNPAAIQRRVFDTLEQVSNGEVDVVDPSNPFVFLLEASSVLTSASMEEAENLTRQLYPSMALTEDELYLHMSDQDYVGRFSSPSRTMFTVLFNKEELMQRAVDVGENGVRKITIPRNTEFQVSDYTFTMEYPIDIRVMPYGGLQVVYDVSKVSPLQTLASNVVDWGIVKLKGDDYLRLQIPVNQFKVSPHYAHLTKSTNYSKTFSLEDPFYYCRAYRAGQNGWVEIRTTHTDQVFDPNNPTVVLKVTGGKLAVSVPQVYISNRTLDGELRFDIYTTKGPVDIILDSYEINAFSAQWRDIAREDNRYSAPLNVFTSMAVYSDAVVTGGSAGLTFLELRERVMTNSLGNSQIPITNNQLTARLANMGYQAIKDIDNVTNRIFLASRRLPSPKSNNTVGGAACMVGTLQGTFEELGKYDGVMANGNRMTVTSGALFYRDNGVTRLVPNNVKDELSTLAGNALVNHINDNRYLTTPFHYVLDGDRDYFDVRAYYLDDPSITQREFVEENVSLGMSVVTDQMTVLKKDDGYRLQIVTRSGDLVKELDDEEVYVQLSYRPPNERRDVYVNGKLIKRTKDERVFEFRLNSRFDVTADNHLMLDSFTMYPDEIKPYRANLSTAFNLVYYIADGKLPDTREPLKFKGAEFMIGAPVTGATWEKVTVKFGDWLEGFWENSRTVVSSQAYLTYEQDVFAVYEENVYQRDPVTGTIDVSLNENGEVSYEVLHRKGDPVLDDDGNEVIRHFKGETVMDDSGSPIVANDRGLLREWDMFFFDARYRFATRQSDVSYLKEVPRTLVGWLGTDLKEFRAWALEKTEIFLYPLRTMGSAEAIVGEGEVKRVDLEQGFTVTFYQTREKYDDPFVRETLTNVAKEVLCDALLKPQITLNDIISKMTAQSGEDAIACDVEGLGGELDLMALTLRNETERCSVRKRLERTLDGGYEVVDDINVVFVRHQLEA